MDRKRRVSENKNSIGQSASPNREENNVSRGIDQSAKDAAETTPDLRWNCLATRLRTGNNVSTTKTQQTVDILASSPHITIPLEQLQDLLRENKDKSLLSYRRIMCTLSLAEIADKSLIEYQSVAWNTMKESIHTRWIRATSSSLQANCSKKILIEARVWYVLR